MPRGRAKREYPSDVIQRVQEMYASGSTVREIGIAIGPGYKAQTLVERFVPVRRTPAKRDQRGERNHMWKGDAAKYQALHLRVDAARGKPARCATCGTTDPAVRYEWANLTGRYEDVDDYERLCVICHRGLDARRRAELGEPTVPAHLRRGGGAECRD